MGQSKPLSFPILEALDLSQPIGLTNRNIISLDQISCLIDTFL